MAVKRTRAMPQGHGYYACARSERRWPGRLVLFGVVATLGALAAVAGFLAPVVL